MNTDIRNLQKWLNEDQEAPIDRQALARVLAMAEQPAPAPIGTVWDVIDEYIMETRNYDRNALVYLAQPPAQQEPVAVVSGYYGGQCVILPINPARIFNSNTALYTSPTAQRKPLTDEQISAIGSKIFPSTWNIRHVDFARSIEAAHGIKENT